MIWNYDKNPDNKGCILSIYHALMKVDSVPVDRENMIFNDDMSAKIAELDFNRLEQIFKHAFKQKFKVHQIVTNRWPYSVHVPEVGHFAVKARVMAKTFGNIVFGNSHFGTPSFEEALYRGHCAANKILWRMNPKFVQESWSKC